MSRWSARATRITATSPARVAMRLAPVLRRAPRDVAADLAERADFAGLVERADVAGPGFLNLRVAPAWYEAALAELLEAGDRYGAGSSERAERIQVEMVSANPTGPITVAAARNGAYGDCVARLCELAGHSVEREYYYNDAGSQMEKFRASVEAARRGEEPPDDGYRGAYIQELALLDGDPVPHMLEQIERTLERFRIHFDSWARQSELERELPELLGAAAHVRVRRSDLRPIDRSTATTRTGCCSARRSAAGSPPTRLRTSPTSATSWSAASTA